MSNSAIDRHPEQLLQQRDIQFGGNGMATGAGPAFYAGVCARPRSVRSLRLTAWAAKVTPDLSFTNAHILTSRPAWRWLRGRR